MSTGIEWTDETWNPVTGCTKVSPGCDHCYAETIAHRFAGSKAFPNGFDVTLHPDRLDQPLRWRKPRRVFVNSMSDLFHDAVPDEYIARVFAVMAHAQQHTFQILTKRHARMRTLLRAPWFPELVTTWAWREGVRPSGPMVELPAPNIWLGTSVETQQWADIRVPALVQTPAAVRFLSCEPLLGPIRLHHGLTHCPTHDFAGGWCTGPCPDRIIPDWVIVGGESGPGARPMNPDWARSLRDQCTDAGVPFFFKQWGAWEPNGTTGIGRPLLGETRVGDPVDEHGFRTGMRRVGKKAAGRELDGREWSEYPQAVTT